MASPLILCKRVGVKTHIGMAWETSGKDLEVLRCNRKTQDHGEAQALVAITRFLQQMALLHQKQLHTVYCTMKIYRIFSPLLLV